MLDMLANFDWKRPISFSSGGMYDSENIFIWMNICSLTVSATDWFPFIRPQGPDGDKGRVDAQSLYQVVKNFRWGNFKDLSIYYDETATSNILGYRMSVSRAVSALVAGGQKAKAFELLELAAKEIPC